MMPIGSRPVLWHVMRYYAHFGHTEFILCLGYGAHAVKDYFLDYRETSSNDFVLSKGGQHVEMLGTDISDWTITFIDTGIDTAIGERLRRVRPYLEDDEIFLANYGDVLTDAPMNDLIDEFEPSDAVASLLAVKPQDSFHVVDIDGGGPGHRADGRSRTCRCASTAATSSCGRASSTTWTKATTSSWTAVVRAAGDGKMLRRRRYDGFWAPMDTLKERTALEEQYRSGRQPVGAVARAARGTGPRDHPGRDAVPGVGRCPVARPADGRPQPDEDGGLVICLVARQGPLDVLCLGAHPDDIEIGCGGTLLTLADRPATTVAGAGPHRRRPAAGGGARRRCRPSSPAPRVERARTSPTAGCPRIGTR